MISIQPVGTQIAYKGTNLKPNNNLLEHKPREISKTGTILGNIGWCVMFIGLVMAMAKGISNFAAKLNKQNNVENTESQHKTTTPDTKLITE